MALQFQSPTSQKSTSHVSEEIRLHNPQVNLADGRCNGLVACHDISPTNPIAAIPADGVTCVTRVNLLGVKIRKTHTRTKSGQAIPFPLTDLGKSTRQP